MAEKPGYPKKEEITGMEKSKISSQTWEHKFQNKISALLIFE
jgi:hypothetical protein